MLGENLRLGNMTSGLLLGFLLLPSDILSFSKPSSSGSKESPPESVALRICRRVCDRVCARVCGRVWVSWGGSTDFALLLRGILSVGVGGIWGGIWGVGKVGKAGEDGEAGKAGDYMSVCLFGRFKSIRNLLCALSFAAAVTRGKVADFGPIRSLATLVYSVPYMAY